MTSAEKAYRVLKEMSVSFTLKPGERVNEVELARRLHMSRAPLREAMNRLVTEGLLTFIPNHGFSCRKLSASEVAGLYSVRADLEAGGLKETLGRADAAALRELARSWEEVVARAEELPIDALVSADEKFHLQLAALGGNRERQELLVHINARIYFVRRINLESAARRKVTLAEHGKLLTRMLAGDLEGASAILRRHLDLSADQAMQAIRQGLGQIYAESVV